ncbi:MAG: SIR2 family protein [Smithella sp.]|nr:SIR2 family protein [Smithella sp.]
MSKDNETLIPQNIRSYFHEIAERLWSGHATIMVGAGFSRNAKKSDPAKKDFPTWNQLGDIFYNKIYGHCPSEKHNYLNVLNLADELQAALGRPTLDHILRKEIPDEDHEPSHLHIKLMELPWVDIFTTNYDTLLERACINVTSQKFDIVINKQDLVYSEKPRIIKLHGSFPSERPFIITEEDYRKYPKKFAPFVNTVQQSLLENTLCLVGFSGDDPNFLQWIGWIHDNLGKDNSPKIYLIGLLNLSDAQKKLLEQRNVVSLNLSSLPGIDGNHEKAMNTFLDFLASQKKSEKNIEWPGTQKSLSPKGNEDSVNQLLAILKEWKTIRNDYPNWIIVPEDRRSALWTHTLFWIPTFKSISSLSMPDDIEFLFEMNWRLEKCLSPIFNNMIDDYEKILNRYNPFPEIIIIEGAINPKSLDYTSLPWERIKNKWLELHISIMRFYREEGFLDKWDTINEKIQNIYQFLSPELIAKLHYERCLHFLFYLKISEVRSQIKEWPVNTSLPLWEAKRAGILAELGNIEEAEKILENSLSFIRSQLNLVPISRDYSWVSQEAYVMSLFQYIKDARSFRGEQFEERQKIRRIFNERWNDLKQYKCDPWTELKLFEIYLEHEAVPVSNISQKKEFDIGRVTATRHFSRENKEAATAYSFLRYCEEAGMPFKIPGITYGKGAAKGAIKRIANYSPYWAFASLVRIGDSKVVDEIFNRKSMVTMDISQVDRLIDHYIAAIESIFPEIEIGDRFHQDNFAIALASVIPEILSRLCVKCSGKARLKLLAFLKILYSSDQKIKFTNVAQFTERLIGSFSEEKQYKLIPNLLKFPILSNLHFLIKREFPEPFHFLSVDSELITGYDKIKIDQDIIRDLLQKLYSTIKEERNRAFLRLEKLYRFNLLDNEQVKSLGVALWSQINDKSGFPKNTDFYNFAFTKLPHPETVDPVYLFKEFALNEPFPVQGSNIGQGISMTGGNIPIFYEILGAAVTGIDWSNDETVQIFNKLIEWWDADKHYLKEDAISNPFSNIQDEFRARFWHLAPILANVIAPRLSIMTDTNIKSTVSRLLNELHEYEIPSLRAHVALVNLFPDDKPHLYSKIENAISSNDHYNIVDAIEAIWAIIKSDNASSFGKSDIANSLILVSQQIKWRRKLGLVSSLNLMSNIVDITPKYLSNILLSDILIGLSFLSNESDPINTDMDTDIADKLEYRKQAAYLAYRLYRHFSCKRENVPKVIADWKVICTSLNEFAEIRNEWLEVH